MQKKILYLFDASDWGSRMAVAEKARQDGFNVVIGLIHGDKTAQSKAPDFKIIPLEKSDNKIGISSSLKMVSQIRALIQNEQPDILHTVTLKYGFITGLAAFSHPALKKIYTLAGLGYIFRGSDSKSKLLQSALRPFLKWVLRRKNTTLIFQNPDDMSLMIRKSYACAEHSVLIRGSGVYLDRFNPEHEKTDPPVILMPTRLVHEKGVAIFIEAARSLTQKGFKADFQIAGGETKHNPKAISRAEMEEMIKGTSVNWLGRVDDLPERLAQATLIVYPSYYGEGIPRVLLESCAAGCAIVTTDHPGCREAVDDGENGLLVPVKNVQETASAIERLLNTPETLPRMRRHSRLKAEKEFDIHKIVAQTVQLYHRI
ncbi:MAG: glycosyltransferase family 4 protein [Alphaproteobacteria bacterium]